MENRGVRKIIFLVLFLALFLLVARLFYPFLTILLWSGLFYAFLEPVHNKASRRRDGQPRREPARTLIAGSFALGGILLIAVPAVFLGIALVRQAGELAGTIKRALETNPRFLDLSPDGVLGGFIYRLSGGAVKLSSIDLKGEILSFLAGKTSSIISFSGIVLKDAAGLIIALAFMVFTLYFFFIDGRHLVAILIRAIPIENSYTAMFLRKLRDTGKQLLQGYFLVALFQASIMLILCLVFKVPAALVMACLTAIASFVPMIGTALVWVPVSALLFSSGNTVGALAFFVLAAFFVASLDNFIRPLLLRERLKIHPLLIFFSILGGLKVFGFNGLVLGPLILMLFFAAAELYDKGLDQATEETDADEKRRLEKKGEEN